MHLTIREMMVYTAEERRRWEQWFRENGDEMLCMPIAGPAETTIGQLVMHIFGGELRFVQHVRRDPLTEYHHLPSGSVDAVFGFGMKSRQALRELVDDLPPADWERVVEYPVGEPRLKATIRKSICGACVHEIRHWAQIARLVRERGFAPPGDHDLLFSSALE